MTTDAQDLLNLIAEIRQAKQQLVQSDAHKEHLYTQYRQAVDAHDQADREYVNLMHVFEYCVQHDCDPAYAKLMLSDSHQSKSGSTRMTRGSMLQHPPAAAESPFSRGMGSSPPPRTIKQTLVDWLMKS